MLKVGVQYLAPPDMCQNVLDTESPDVARVKSDLTLTHKILRLSNVQPVLERERLLIQERLFVYILVL